MEMMIIIASFLDSSNDAQIDLHTVPYYFYMMLSFPSVPWYSSVLVCNLYRSSASNWANASTSQLNIKKLTARLDT